MNNHLYFFSGEVQEIIRPDDLKSVIPQSEGSPLPGGIAYAGFALPMSAPICFSKDGLYGYGMRDSSSSKLWKYRMDTKTFVSSMSLPSGYSFYGICMSADGNTLFLAAADRLFVVDAHTLNVMRQVLIPSVPFVDEEVAGAVECSLSPDGTKIAWAKAHPNTNGEIRVFNTNDFSTLWSATIPANSRSRVWIGWSPDSTKVFLTSLLDPITIHPPQPFYQNRIRIFNSSGASTEAPVPSSSLFWTSAALDVDGKLYTLSIVNVNNRVLFGADANSLPLSFNRILIVYDTMTWSVIASKEYNDVGNNLYGVRGDSSMALGPVVFLLAPATTDLTGATISVMPEYVPLPRVFTQAVNNSYYRGHRFQTSRNGNKKKLALYVTSSDIKSIWTAPTGRLYFLIGVLGGTYDNSTGVTTFLESFQLVYSDKGAGVDASNNNLPNCFNEVPLMTWNTDYCCAAANSGLGKIIHTCAVERTTLKLWFKTTYDNGQTYTLPVMVITLVRAETYTVVTKPTGDIELNGSSGNAFRSTNGGKTWGVLA